MEQSGSHFFAAVHNDTIKGLVEFVPDALKPGFEPKRLTQREGEITDGSKGWNQWLRPHWT
jgi:hypothetical protein